LPREHRKLAAILFADVVGSSRLMGRDESGTVARLLEHLNRRLAPAAARCGGRVIRLKGDGGLVEFGSAVDALRAAIEFQQAMIEANRDQPEDKAIVFRIGLHLGDVIVEGDDIYGDDVNVAARLEAEAPPGGIVVSRAVREAVNGRIKAKLHALGDLALKNIERPIRAFRVEWIAEDWTAPNGEQPPPVLGAPPLPAEVAPALALPDKPSIAVLPFQNLSDDAEQEYFVDGLVEDIITGLSRFKSLFVIARNSSFAYKGKSPDIRQVGRELGVRYVLEGSVRKSGNRLRITGQLIEAGDGTHLWVDRFEGVLEDVFAFQDEVTEKVVAAIAPRVEQVEVARAKRRPSGNTDAYDCYLRGLSCLSFVTVDSTEEALRLFTRAIALDPDYAAAYGMAMRCHAFRVSFGSFEDMAQEKSEVTRLWRMVARVGQDDGIALGLAGWAVAHVLRDLASATPLIDRALELNPNLASAWLYSGWINLWLGKPDLAMEHLGRAQRLDPGTLGAVSRWSATAHACFFLGRYEEAVAVTEHMLRNHPDAHPALRIGAASAAFAGRSDLAHRLAARLQVVDPAFAVSRLQDYLGPYQKPEFAEKYAEGLRCAGLPE
jgi:TolB-like protein/class 3 adenylate cyclase